MIGQGSGPQPFWHQGLVSWKTIFPQTGEGDGSGDNGSDGSGGHTRDGERWAAADEASLAHLLLTSCRAARFLTGPGSGGSHMAKAGPIRILWGK